MDVSLYWILPRKSVYYGRQYSLIGHQSATGGATRRPWIYPGHRLTANHVSLMFLPVRSSRVFRISFLRQSFSLSELRRWGWFSETVVQAVRITLDLAEKRSLENFSKNCAGILRNIWLLLVLEVLQHRSLDTDIFCTFIHFQLLCISFPKQSFSSLPKQSFNLSELRRWSWSKYDHCRIRRSPEILG